MGTGYPNMLPSVLPVDATPHIKELEERYKVLAASHERLVWALHGLIDCLGPDGYFTSAGEPKTRKAREALAEAEKLTK